MGMAWRGGMSSRWGGGGVAGSAARCEAGWQAWAVLVAVLGVSERGVMVCSAGALMWPSQVAREEPCAREPQPAA